LSVPEPNRGEGELAVNTKCRQLVVYTLKILENEKWFPQGQKAFITKLQDCVIEIAALCWEANNIKVGKDKEHCKTVVVDKLAKIGFEVNEKKTKVYRLSEGIPFLGFRFSLTETGKVLMFVNPDKVKSARKKYRRLVAKEKRGEVPRESVDMSWATWINHLSKGDTYNLINRLNKFYKKLWEDDKDGTEKKDAVPGRTGETGEHGSTGRSQPGKH
jgi:hypothetical protein